MLRVAIILIEDSQGRLFAHRRRQDKRIFPGLIGLGAGGRIEDGETPAEGAARELLEETGLQRQPTPVAEFPFENEGVHYTVHVYHMEAEPPVPNDDTEWSWSAFVSPAEVKAFIARGDLCPDTQAAFQQLMRWKAEQERRAP